MDIQLELKWRWKPTTPDNLIRNWIARKVMPCSSLPAVGERITGPPFSGDFHTTITSVTRIWPGLEANDFEADVQTKRLVLP